MGGYRVRRKVQETSGSYWIVLPKLWVEANDIRTGDTLEVVFNGKVEVLPPAAQTNRKARS